MMSELQAGPELDAAIDRAVFGLQVDPTGPGALGVAGWVGEDGRVFYRPIGAPAYSTSIAAAWLVVEHMLDQPDQERYLTFVNAWGAEGFVAPGYMAARRICRAALKAMGTE